MAITIHCQDQENPPIHLKPPTKNIKEFWKFFQTSIFPTNTTSHPPTAEKAPTFHRDPRPASPIFLDHRINHFPNPPIFLASPFQFIFLPKQPSSSPSLPNQHVIVTPKQTSLPHPTTKTPVQEQKLPHLHRCQHPATVKTTKPVSCLSD